MENDEFVKFVLEHGDVRPLEEAFKENPVEEEEHKGKLSAYVAEEKGIYKYVAKYEVGDIVFVKEYKYQDGRNGSNHLFVIIDKNNMAIPIEYLTMIISSKIEKVRYKTNKFLPADEQNNLNTDSIVKTDVIYTINDEDIIVKIGTVEAMQIEEYKKCYKANRMRMEKQITTHPKRQM